MFDAPADLNWLAIALATLAYYLLGAVWFTPLFGKAWDRSIGFHRQSGHRFDIAYYIVPLASAFAVTVAVAIVLSALSPETLAEAAVLGVVIGLGVAAAVSINNGLTPHTPRPFLFGAVTGGYHFLGIVIVSVIVGAFTIT